MSEEELLALPVTFDLPTAGRGFGISRSKSYALARAGDFPIPVLRVGKQYRVRRCDLLKALGVHGVSEQAA